MDGDVKVIYTGRGGYHGGGRKKKAESEKKVFVTSSISGSPEEMTALKQKAKENGKTLSRFVIETILN